jgi:gliding motility-associated protein GldL
MGKQVTGFRPGSKSWKLFMAKVYGIGGGIVIIGALFKIMHWPGASLMLILGLGVEAAIFFISAFEPPHEDPDWSLVYPQLDGIEVDGDHSHAVTSGGNDKSLTSQLDEMLEEAKIEPELIQSLGDGLRTLSSQAGKLTEITDASVATNDYVSSLKSASSKVGELSENYSKASQALTGLSESSSAGAETGEHLQKLSQNLAALNNVYEMQLKGSSESLEASNKLYGGINELMENLANSVEDTKKYKDNIAELSKNLASLNTIYGNMLSAMNFRQNPGA